MCVQILCVYVHLVGHIKKILGAQFVICFDLVAHSLPPRPCPCPDSPCCIYILVYIIYLYAYLVGVDQTLTKIIIVAHLNSMQSGERRSVSAICDECCASSGFCNSARQDEEYEYRRASSG